jgi:hypothetical protein
MGTVRALLRVAAAAAIAASALLLHPGPAAGDDDYSEADFSLRLASAFVRFRDVTTAGGLTVANRWPSALNPASADGSRVPAPHGVTVAAYHSPIWFREGTHLGVSGLAVNAQTPWGAFQPAVSMIRSNDATTRQGLGFDYAVDSAQLSWARRRGRTALGAGFNFAHASLEQDLGPVRVSDSLARSYRVRLGGLHEPRCGWLVGAIAEFGWADFRSDVLAVTPAGPAIVRLVDTDRQAIAQAGVSYAYGEHRCVFADYQFSRFWSDDRGSLVMHRISFGADHQLVQPVFLRPTLTIDGRGNLEPAFGVGVHFARWGGIDLGWKYDAFPELRREFGRSHTLQLTLGLRL